ncbi:hypothetical protein DNTS_031016, partial [Danionella cerebrum]
STSTGPAASSSLSRDASPPSADSLQRTLTIAEKELRKQCEREEQKQRDLTLEAEKDKYNYWGRGEGGAPLEEVSENLITDLKAHLRKNDTCKSVARGEKRPASPKID